MPRSAVVAAVSLLILLGVVGVIRGTTPTEADSPDPAPASTEGAEQKPAEAPETTSEENPASGEADPAAGSVVPAGREMANLDRRIKESCAARAGVPVPGPEELVAEGDGRFKADPEYLECLAAEGQAVDKMLGEERPVEEILQARYGG